MISSALAYFLFHFGVIFMFRFITERSRFCARQKMKTLAGFARNFENCCTKFHSVSDNSLIVTERGWGVANYFLESPDFHGLRGTGPTDPSQGASDFLAVVSRTFGSAVFKSAYGTSMVLSNFCQQ